MRRREVVSPQFVGISCLAAVIALAVLATRSHASDTASNGASEIFGLWQTPKNDGRVIVLPCHESLCARIVDGSPLRANPDQRDVLNPDPAKRVRRVKGLFILEGYVGGPTEWHGGIVYDPQTGDFSNDSTLRFEPPSTLIVEGCRFFFCRSETWTKLSDANDETRQSDR